MTVKPQHSKGKHHPQSKKGRAMQRSTAMAPQQQIVAQTQKQVVPASMPTPSASVRTTSATPGAARYPYITTELRRIGILAGIMLAILIVLALILP